MVRGERTILDAQMMEIVITEGEAHYTLGECKWELEREGCEKTKKRYSSLSTPLCSSLEELESALPHKFHANSKKETLPCT